MTLRVSTIYIIAMLETTSCLITVKLQMENNIFCTKILKSQSLCISKGMSGFPNKQFMSIFLAKSLMLILRNGIKLIQKIFDSMMNKRQTSRKMEKCTMYTLLMQNVMDIVWWKHNLSRHGTLPIAHLVCTNEFFMESKKA